MVYYNGATIPPLLLESSLTYWEFSYTGYKDKGVVCWARNLLGVQEKLDHCRAKYYVHYLRCLRCRPSLPLTVPNPKDNVAPKAYLRCIEVSWRDTKVALLDDHHVAWTPGRPRFASPRSRFAQICSRDRVNFVSIGNKRSELESDSVSCQVFRRRMVFHDFAIRWQSIH